MSSRKENLLRTNLEYSQEDLEGASRAIVVNELSEKGQEATKENIDRFIEDAKDSYLIVEHFGKHAISKWHLINHQAVKLVLSKKNVEKG